MNNDNLFKKEIKIFNVLISFEKFRMQNKNLPLPHKLFKSGINRHENENGNVKFISIVVKNYRLLIIK